VPPLPPPLPPEERTVGQLVAEAIRLYGRRFFPSLALGLGPAALNALVRVFDDATLVVVSTLGSVVLSACYVGACVIAGERRGNVWAALAAGTIVFVPFAFLTRLFILPGLIWLAFVGLVVPVLVYERRGIPDAFVRATRLARADFVHALGSLATLAIVVVLTQLVLTFLLRGTGEQTLEIASFLASLVVSPLLFLGAALLYFDQAARENQRHVQRR
jgi:hypothetical protein